MKIVVECEDLKNIFDVKGLVESIQNENGETIAVNTLRSDTGVEGWSPVDSDDIVQIKFAGKGVAGLVKVIFAPQSNVKKFRLSYKDKYDRTITVTFLNRVIVMFYNLLHLVYEYFST